MDDFAIKVENVSKVFKLPYEKNSSIKSAAVNFYKRDKGYELQKALENVSLEIKKGEFFGIVGRNGSGKSTLLKLLAGIYTPTSGQIHLRGSLTPFIELGVGFNPELTGRENVYLNGSLLGFSRKEMGRMYKDIVEFAELEKFMDQKLKNYSSGMQVRLAFSIAIRTKSDILLIDEVLAVGDSRFQQKCFKYFYDLKKDKRTVIFVSHDLQSVQKFCDRAAWIDGGVKKSDGDPNTVIDDYRVAEFELGKKRSSKSVKTNDKISDIEINFLDGKKYKHTDTLKIDYKYKLLKSQEVELRLAIVRDGIPFAQVNTKGSKLSTKPGTYHAQLEIVLDGFMDGEHDIYCSIVNPASDEELGFVSNANAFYITDGDQTKYGLMRLDCSWSKLPLQ